MAKKGSPFDEYDMLEQIGNGSFGSVHRARHKIDNRIVAVKIMKRKFNSISECVSLREFKVLKQLSAHPNIVQLYDSYLSPNKEFYFVMEYINGGNMYQLIKCRRDAESEFARWEIRSIVYQVLSGLAHVHKLGIFHRDMKPENLLIDNTPSSQGSHSRNNITVKIADFGLAREMKSRPPYTEYVSTRWYRAPEVLLRSNSYSFPVDLWAVGAIFAELITLRPLFPGQSEIDQVFRICELLGNPSPSTTYTGGVQRRMSEKKVSPGFARKRSESIKVESPVLIMSPSLPEAADALPIGGGEWREGVKLAGKIGFQFPKAILPNATHTMLDLLEHLLYYDPKLRLTAEAAMAHPFFLETEGDDEARSHEGTGGANQESEDPDDTSHENKGGRGLERHGTNKGIIIADETNEERLQRSHQRLAFITENDHLMRRVNGKKEKSSSKASSSILGKRADNGAALANQKYKSTDILPLSLQNSVKAQFDLPAIPLSPFEFGEGWPPYRKSSISSFTDGPLLTINHASGATSAESTAFAASIGSLLEDMRSSITDDCLMQRAPGKQPVSQNRQADRFSAPSSYQETSLHTKIRQTRRTLSSEDHTLNFDCSSSEQDANSTKSDSEQTLCEPVSEMSHLPLEELSVANVYSNMVNVLESTGRKKQQGRPLSDIPVRDVAFKEFSTKQEYVDQHVKTSENVPPTPIAPPPLNCSKSTPLSSVNNAGTLQKLVSRTGFQSTHPNTKHSSAAIPRSATYESLQTTSHIVKKQERSRIGHRFRQAATHGESTKQTTASSGFFNFKKRTPGVVKDKAVNDSSFRGGISPLQEDLPYHPMQFPFDIQSPPRTSSARPSEYHYRPQSNATSARQPSSFEILIAEEIEQAWAPQPIRIPQVTIRTPQDRHRFL